MRKLESRELDILLAALDQSLQEGALGLSSGQSYVHESAVSELEIFETAKIVKHYDGLLSIHLRSEGEQLLESLEEVLEIARRSEVRMKLSHFKVYHKKNWPLLKSALEMLENAVHQGVDIMYDAYPFTSIWQPLYTYLPDWAKLGGRVATLKRLQDPISRKKVLEGLKEHAGQLAGLVIASTSFPMHVTSKTLAKVAMSYDLSVEEALLKVLENGGVEILVFDDCLESTAVEELMRHPLGVVATDGGGFQYETSVQGRHKDKLVHPRCFGASAEFLQQVRVKNLISLEEAVSKLASEPARLAGLYNRGTIEVGKVADLVLFDPENVRNRATLTNPYVPPEGIASVWVNGQCVVADGKLLNVKPGNFLTKVKDD
jgi:N-acyl-D-amino-acid deacylase